jgi:uncharacterized membrane protein
MHTLAVIAVVVSLGLIACGPGAAFASTVSEQRQGATALQRFERGGKHCSLLTGADLDHIGEYEMGRMSGSTPAHEAMDSLMERMMGEAATDRMHVALGERYTGCGRGEIPASFGAIAGMMGSMSGRGRPSASQGNGSLGLMVGGGGGAFGSMMGRRYHGGGDDDSDAVEIVILVLLAMLAAVGIAALWLSRRAHRVPSSSALDILNERLARGELDERDYESRRRAIESPGPPDS